MSNEGIKKVFITKLTDTNTLDLEGIGVLRFEGARIFKWVKYNSGGDVVAAVAGNMCYYHGDDGVVLDSAAEVTSDLSSSGAAGAEVGAGMLMAVIATGSFGWVQIKGVAVLTTALDAGIDGDRLTPTGASDGTLTAVDITSVTTANTMICAIALDASAKIVLLDCPW